MATSALHAGQLRGDAGLNRRLQFAYPVLLSALVCACFAACGAAAVAIYLTAIGFPEEPGYFIRLWIKVAAFSAIGLVCFYGVRRSAPQVARNRAEDATRAHDISRGLFLLIVISTAGIVGTLILPNLSRFPWTAPDELHHLIVARNLAEHGAYASGAPEESLRYFDNYDSIGPSVIMPLAGVFRMFGTSYVAARVMVAAFYVLLCVLVYRFVASEFGGTSAIASVLLLTCSMGTVYLARSFYGEVPAMAFFLAALTAWNYGFKGMPNRLPLLLAGVFLGLAFLAKSFLILSVFALAGAWLHDRLTERRISASHVLLPLAGVAIVFTAWSLYQLPYRNLVGEDAPSLLYYRHYLTFGLQSVPNTLAWWLAHPTTLMSTLVGVAFAGHLLLQRRLGPAWIALYLTAMLYLFWWIAFTPGLLSRYLWYSFAVLAMFCGPMVNTLLSAPPTHRWNRLAWASSLTLLGVCAAWTVRVPLTRVYTLDDMRDDLALAAALENLPDAAEIATTYWPAERTANFFANRTVHILDDEEADTMDYVVVQSSTLPIDTMIVQQAGRYTIVAPAPLVVAKQPDITP